MSSILRNVTISVLVFSFFVIGFFTTPNSNDGKISFWRSYGLEPGNSGNISQFDKTTETYATLSQLQCDINSDNEDCQETQTSLIDEGIGIINGIVKGGFGMLVTLLDSISIFKSIILDFGLIMGIPRLITDLIWNVALTAMLLAAMFLIFNRSDLS